ncbi:MAG: YkgJ family cysteine cluster protein [Phycisphaerales bacterium]|nr:YkgJ family cysteine cluster protein [Phycisphaerales bacterium]
MGSVLCEHCTGVCCRYIALPIEKPTERRDFDDIRWYVMHQGISVFVEEGDWYIQFATPCKNLLPDNRCGVYETRPEICREYEADECDYAGGDYHYEMQFFTPEAIEKYAIERLGKRGVFTHPPKAPQRKSNGSKSNGSKSNGKAHLTSLKVLTHRG